MEGQRSPKVTGSHLQSSEGILRIVLLVVPSTLACAESKHKLLQTHNQKQLHKQDTAGLLLELRPRGAKARLVVLSKLVSTLDVARLVSIWLVPSGKFGKLMEIVSVYLRYSQIVFSYAFWTGPLGSRRLFESPTCHHLPGPSVMGHTDQIFSTR